jgi:hypothetical protein
MNERIRELVRESNLDVYGLGKERYRWEYTVEKFAELIVKECLTQVDKVDAMLEDGKEKVGVAWVGLAIAKHFGVEE